MRSGPATVIGSGMVTAFWGHDLDLSMVYNQAALSVTLGWARDPEIEGVDVRTQWPETGGIRFELVNFDQPDGRGTAQPVLITEVGDDAIFLHFRVFRFGRTDDRTVHYCFYAVDKSSVGWDPVVEGGGHDG